MVGRVREHRSLTGNFDQIRSALDILYEPANQSTRRSGGSYSQNFVSIGLRLGIDVHHEAGLAPSRWPARHGTMPCGPFDLLAVASQLHATCLHIVAHAHRLPVGLVRTSHDGADRYVATAAVAGSFQDLFDW